MTTETMLRVFRDKITEIDPATSLYSDADLTALLGDALTKLQVKLVQAVIALSFDEDTNEFSGEISDGAGLLIAYQAAVDLLRRELRGRLKRGEFGISWSSGLEEESSVTAAKSYGEMVESLEAELQLFLITQGPTAGTRSQ